MEISNFTYVVNNGDSYNTLLDKLCNFLIVLENFSFSQINTSELYKLVNDIKIIIFSGTINLLFNLYITELPCNYEYFIYVLFYTIVNLNVQIIDISVVPDSQLLPLQQINPNDSYNNLLDKIISYLLDYNNLVSTNYDSTILNSLKFDIGNCILRMTTTIAQDNRIGNSTADTVINNNISISGYIFTDSQYIPYNELVAFQYNSSPPSYNNLLDDILSSLYSYNNIDYTTINNNYNKDNINSFLINLINNTISGTI